jgi:uncharacterized membrane protein
MVTAATADEFGDDSSFNATLATARVGSQEGDENERQEAFRGRNLELVLDLASDIEPVGLPADETVEGRASDIEPVELPADETVEGRASDIEPVELPADETVEGSTMVVGSVVVIAAEELPAEGVLAAGKLPVVTLDLAPDLEPTEAPAATTPEHESLAAGADVASPTVGAPPSEPPSGSTGGQALPAAGDKAARKAMARERAAKAAGVKRDADAARAAAVAAQRAAVVTAAAEDRAAGRARTDIASCFEPTCPRPWRDSAGAPTPGAPFTPASF